MLKYSKYLIWYIHLLCLIRRGGGGGGGRWPVTRVGFQSRAQSFYGSLSAVGRREKLWDNGISNSNLIGSSYNNT